MSHRRSHIGRDAGFLGSDSNIHAKHPQGTPEGWWILDSDPNKPERTVTCRPHTAFYPHHLGSHHLLEARERLARRGVLEGGEDE